MSSESAKDSSGANVLEQVCTTSVVQGRDNIIAFLISLCEDGKEGVSSAPSIERPLLIGSRAMLAYPVVFSVESPMYMHRYARDWDFMATAEQMLALFRSPAQIDSWDSKCISYYDNHRDTVVAASAAVSVHVDPAPVCVRRKLCFPMTVGPHGRRVECDVELVSGAMLAAVTLPGTLELAAVPATTAATTAAWLLRWMHDPSNNALVEAQVVVVPAEKADAEWTSIRTILNFVVAPPWVLHALKESHIYWPIDFEKHIHDLHAMRKHIPIRDEKELRLKETWTAWRRLEHERLHGIPGAHINLDQTNEAFLEESDLLAVQRYIPHDDIHKLVMYGAAPIYDSLKQDPSKAMVSRTMFEQASLETRLRCVREEAMVIALERYLLPQRLHIGHEQLAYTHGLTRICTTLTKGFFREFAVNHYPLLQKLDRDLKPIYNCLQKIYATKRAQHDQLRAASCGIQVATTYFAQDPPALQEFVQALLCDRTRSVYIPACVSESTPLLGGRHTGDGHGHRGGGSGGASRRVLKTTKKPQTLTTWKRPLGYGAGDGIVHGATGSASGSASASASAAAASGQPIQSSMRESVAEMPLPSEAVRMILNSATKRMWKKPVWLLLHPTDPTKYLGMTWNCKKRHEDDGDNCPGASSDHTDCTIYILLSHHAEARNVDVFDLSLSEHSGNSGGSLFVHQSLHTLNDLLEEVGWPAAACNYDVFLRVALAVLNPELEDVSVRTMQHFLRTKYLRSYFGCGCPVPDGHNAYHRPCQKIVAFCAYQERHLKTHHLFYQYFRAAWFWECPFSAARVARMLATAKNPLGDEDIVMASAESSARMDAASSSSSSPSPTTSVDASLDSEAVLFARVKFTNWRRL